MLVNALILDIIESIVKYISNESAIGLDSPNPTMFLSSCWPTEKYVMHKNTSCTCTTNTTSNMSKVLFLLPDFNQL